MYFRASHLKDLLKEKHVINGSVAEMSKRRLRVVDKPDRGRGWSNGRYTKARDSNNAAYVAHCPDCGIDTAHEWDDCTVCAAAAKLAKAKPAKKNRGRRRRRNKKK